MLLVPLGLVLGLKATTPTATPARAWWAVLGCYAVAKLFEIADQRLFASLGGLSGHTLKHLVAAAGAAWLLRAVVRRRRGRSAPVVGVDLDVVVAQVAGPDRRRVRPAVQVDADRDLALLHHALAVFLAIGRAAAAAFDDMDVVEEEIDPGLVEVVDAGVADRRQDPAEVRIAGEERRLDQRRMADRVGDLAALVDAARRLRRGW